jgi:lipopolysaccharide cholinephosphotransferase
MKKLDLQEIHQYSLGCLLYFDRICRKYHLRYSLAYGSLIGAIRHKGFIPWDDDVDVMMPREDYKKLISLFLTGKEKDNIYGFLNERANSQYRYTIGRIVDKRTQIKFLDSNQDVDGMGVFIDVYPMDYIYDNQIMRCFFYGIFYFILHMLSCASDSKYIKPKRPGIVRQLLKYLLFEVSHAIGRNKVYAIYYATLSLLPKKSDYMFDAWDLVFLVNTKKIFYIDLMDKSYVDSYKFPTQYFEHLVGYDFEGNKILGIVAADEFLRRRYGDYWQLPPGNMRCPHHDYDAYLLSDD